MKQLILIFFFLVCYASNEQASAQNFMYKERTTGAHASLSLTEKWHFTKCYGRYINFELKDPNYAKDIFLYQNPGEKNAVFMSKTNFSIFSILRELLCFIHLIYPLQQLHQIIWEAVIQAI